MGDIGDNEPPDDLTVLKERLHLLYAHLIKRREDIINAQAAIPRVISTPDEARRLVDFREMVRAARKAAKDAHKVEKEYFLKAGRLCDSFFLTEIGGVLKVVEENIEPRLRKYQESRLAENYSGRVTGELGKTASLTTHWRWRQTGQADVPARYLKIDEEAIQDHIDNRPDKKDAPLPIPGIEFYKETRSR